MKNLEQLYEISEAILQALENEHATNREQTIQQIDELIGKRETIIEQIKGPYTEDEEEIGQKVVQLNEQIKVKMDALYSQVKEDMKQVKQQKKLNRSYINPYGPIKTTDGMYLDRKQ
ncbi:flagellar protein FliT [Pseudogracilibacillus sp. SE30717A]|uniref:flagellar protein FliT n=1 Tax=Pseudogracilibacillus sp. SE30717A TaxID=3098293 RepID=UPI00300E0F84